MTTNTEVDGAPQRVSRVVRHVVHCRPCRESLLKMDDKSAAIAFLEAQTDDHSTSTVERVLARTAEAGKKVLADLIYELAKASFLSDAEFARLIKPLEAPRDIDVVRTDLTMTAQRMGELDEDLADACREAPAALAEHEELSALAKALLNVLEELEGPSARKLLTEGHWLVSEGDHEAARQRFTRVFEDEAERTALRGYAVVGLARSLLLTEEREALAALVIRARRQRVSSLLLELYGVVNTVETGELDAAQRDFVAICGSVGSYPRAAQDQGVVHTIVAYLAEQLDLDRDAIEALEGAA